MIEADDCVEKAEALLLPSVQEIYFQQKIHVVRGEYSIYIADESSNHARNAVND